MTYNAKLSSYFIDVIACHHRAALRVTNGQGLVVEYLRTYILTETTDEHTKKQLLLVMACVSTLVERTVGDILRFIFLR